MYHRKLWKIRIVSDIHVSDSNTFFHLHNTVSTAYTSTTNVMFWNFFSSFKKKNEKAITSTISIPRNCHSTEFCVHFLSFFLLTLYLFLNGKHLYCVVMWRPIFYNDQKCHQKLNPNLRKTSTSISVYNGPVLERFELDSHQDSVYRIFSSNWASSNSSRSCTIQTAPITNLSGRRRIVWRQQLPQEKTMKWRITECNICFNCLDNKKTNCFSSDVSTTLRTNHGSFTSTWTTYRP